MTLGCKRNQQAIGLILLLTAIAPLPSHAAPVISVEPSPLSITGQQYQVVAGQALVVSNSGDADLSYTISSDVLWLSAANPAGNLPAGQATSHLVSVSSAGLDALRSYSGHLTIADPAAANNPQLTTINLTLSPASPPSRVVLWGNNTYYQTNVPASLTNAVAIAGGGYHNLAIRSDGGITAWGTNGHGQTTVPGYLTNVVSISCGWYHSLALQADGSFAVWGRNVEGQTNIPSGLSNIVSLASGSFHALATLQNGGVAAWGFNLYGQTNVPPGLTNVFAVAGGNYHSLALQGNGSVTAWGSDDFGQCTVPGSVTNAVAIAGGGYHSLALLNDGTVAAWGRNVEGQANIPAGLSNVVAIAAGNYHSVAFKNDGSVVAWGRNIEAQTNVPSSLIHATAASAGGYHSLALAPVQSLIVSSSQGSPTPGVGTSWPIPDSTITCSVAATNTSGGTQYVSMGWVGTGDIPLSGSSNGFDFTVTQASTLTWHWQTNYLFSVYATGGGSVGTNVSWQVKDSAIMASATNMANQSFVGWFGNTNGCTINGTDITAPMTQARTLEARFTEPLIAALPSALSFTGQVHSSIASQMLIISNSGTGPMDYQFDSDSVWLTVTPSAGLLPGGQSATCAVHVISRGLDSRTYGGHLTLSDPIATNSPRSMAVSLSLTSIPAPSRIVAWGDNGAGQTNAPIDISNAVSVAGGLFHSLALGADGTVVCWGTNTFGQTNVPVELTNAIAIAAGESHSLALRNDGTVAAWGKNTYNQTNVPPDLTSVIAVAAGASHSLALLADGTVAAWGYNFYDQTNVPSGLSNVISIAGGENHSLALRRDGTVVGWGDSGSGQITPSFAITDAVAIAAANNYSLALRRDGSVVGWGDSIAGQTNVPAGITNAVAIAAGHMHGLALQGDQRVYAWGGNASGQTNVPADLKAFGIAAGGDHSLALAPTWSLYISSSHGTVNPATGLHNLIRDTTQSCWVSSSITDGGTQHVNTGWIGSGSVEASGTTNTLLFTITNDSTLSWLWQTNYLLSLSVEGGTISSNAGWQSKDSTIIVTATNNPYYEFVSWLGDTGGCMMTGTELSAPMTQARNIQALFIAPASVQLPAQLDFVGRAYSNVPGQSFVVSNAGYGIMNYSLASDVFWLSLSNSSGSLGTGDKATHAATVATRGLESRTHYGHISISSTEATNVSQVLTVTLTLTNPVAPVVAWGDDTYNQTNVPSTLTNAVAISAGGNHSVARRANGRIAVWGDNSSGQTNIPVSVTNVILAVGGWNHTLALLPNRTVVAWGNNTSGQTNVPVGLSNVVSLSGGWKHSMALLSNGSVVAWGNNTDGQTNVPPTLSNVVQISAGRSHSMALCGDGHVVAWGDNTYGQTNVPAGLTNIVAIDAGANHSVALRDVGSVVAWGNNTSGQTNVPASLTNVLCIDAGSDHVLALRHDGRMAAWGDNASGQTNIPANLYHGVAVSGGRTHSMALVSATWKLVVTSAFDNPSPPAGTNWILGGTLVSCSVTSDIPNGGTQLVCIGWTGSGSVTSNGGFNEFEMTIQTNSTLTWQWRTNYWLQTSTNGTGYVAPTSAWYRANSNITLTATPAPYRQFVSWTGDVPPSAVNSNPLMLLITGPRYVHGSFINDVTSNGTPTYWLALFGWTNNFEEVVTNDWDGDGLLTWEEYIADAIPTNPSSLFYIHAASNMSGASLTIPTSAGRLYSLDMSTSIRTGTWQGVSGQTNLPGTGGTLTLIDTNPPPFSHYYRIRVALP